MWLLNASTRRLEAFNNERYVIGGYAILSHRWAEAEVIFDEIHLPEAQAKQGFWKIDQACFQAEKDGLKYVWIDTCCIDKRSSAELSEAVNSMFRWYRNARVCYVYLNDFEFHPNYFELAAKTRFQQSTWWSRGWTLQELIAPEIVRFYDHRWHYYSSKADLIDLIYDVTKIDMEVLQDRSVLPKMSVAKRMSWAARRSVSREEDMAYALLGIFNVNMPLLYGEGEYKAFQRLQEEIINTSTFADHSILAWMPWESSIHFKGDQPMLSISSYAGYEEPANYQTLLSPSPYGFRHAHDVVSWGLPHTQTFSLSSRGLRLTILVQRAIGRQTSLTGVLNCRYADQRLSYIVIGLDRRLNVSEGLQHQEFQSSDVVYDRPHRDWRKGLRLCHVMASDVQGENREVTLARQPFIWPHFEDRIHVTGDSRGLYNLESTDLEVIDSFPKDEFDSQLSILSLTTSLNRFNAKLNPAYGAIVMGRSDHPRDWFVVAIDRLSGGNQVPQLLAGVYPRSEVDSLWATPVRRAVNLVPDETHETTVLKYTTLKLTARCVIVSGELLWSLHIRQGDPARL